MYIYCHTYKCNVICHTIHAMNRFLLSCATAVLASWPEAAAIQLQETDRLNSYGYNLPCSIHYLFKFDMTNEKQLLISVTLSLSLLGVFVLMRHMTLFKHLFWNLANMKHLALGHCHTCIQFICQKIITRIIRVFVRT